MEKNMNKTEKREKELMEEEKGAYGIVIRVWNGLGFVKRNYKRVSKKDAYEYQKEHPSNQIKHFKRILSWDLESEAKFIRDCGRNSKGIHYPTEHEKFSDEFYKKALILSIEYIKEDIKNQEEELIHAKRYIKKGITESKKLLKDIEIKAKEEE